MSVRSVEAVLAGPIVLVSLLIVAISPTWPQTVGGACQLLGLGIIAYQLAVRNQEAGRAGVFRRLWWRLKNVASWLWARVRRPLGRTENTPADQSVFLAGGIAATSGVGTPTITTTLEERVEVLGRQLHELGHRLDEMATVVRAELADETARRTDADHQLDRQIADHVDQHLRGERRMLFLDSSGFVLLVPGVILTTWPAEIARWVNGILD